MNDHIETVINPQGYWTLWYNPKTKEWFVNEDERQMIGPFESCEQAQLMAEFMFTPFNVNLSSGG